MRGSVNVIALLSANALQTRFTNYEKNCRQVSCFPLLPLREIDQQSYTPEVQN